MSPATQLCALADPGSFSTSGVHYFDAPLTGAGACPTLAANTSYHFVVGYSGSGASDIDLPAADSGDEDTLTPPTSWMIADDIRVSLSATGSWISFGTPARIEVVAAAVDSPVTGTVTFGGPLRVGEPLTANTSAIADDDGLANVSYAYQWIRVAADNSEADIDGATGSTYELLEADSGASFRVRITFSDDVNNEYELISDAAGPVAAAVPGDPFVANTGQALLTDRVLFAVGIDDTTHVSQEFTTGENADGYVLGSVGFDFWEITNTATAAADLEVTLRNTVAGEPLDAVLCTLVDPAGFSASGLQFFDAPPTTGTGACPKLAASTTYAVVIERVAYREGDDVILGETYSGDEDTLTPATGWTLADDVLIFLSIWIPRFAGETAWQIEIRGSLPPPNVPAGGTPAISGTEKVGETLTASTTDITDSDGLTNPTYAYQWIRVAPDTIESDIGNATGSTYTLVAADAGMRIKVRVFFSDDGGHDETVTSAATGVIAAINKPTISGIERVGERLTASTAGITDNDGITGATYTFQWIRVEPDDTESNIGGATSSTYDLALADEGKRIKVEVAFTDDSSNNETRTSDATGPIAASARVALVDNTGQPLNRIPGVAPGALTTGTPLRGQAFTTGPNLGGYLLTSVGFNFVEIADTAAAAAGLVATLRAAGGDGNPAGTVLCTLSDPATFASSGVNTYAAPLEDAGACPVLAGNTTYFVAMERTDGAATAIELAVTPLGVEDILEPPTGWSIADGSRREVTGGRFLGLSSAFSMRIEGVVLADSLAKNTGQATLTGPGEGPLDDAARSQGFTTGAHAGGYVLDSVGIDFKGIDNPAGAADLRMTLHAPDPMAGTGEPASTALCTLRDPASFSSSGVHFFEAPTTGAGACPLLAASTTYVVVIEDIGGNVSQIAPRWTLSSAEDTLTPATGWTLANISFVYDSVDSDWDPTVSLLKLDVRGTLVPVNRPTISGIEQVGETLTASTAGIADSDGLSGATFTYQWVRVAADNTETVVTGVTFPRYALGIADEGHRIKVVVTFTDDGDNAETRTSELTGVIAAAPSIFLVKNTGQETLATQQGELTSPDTGAAQGFTTGGNDGGYDLGSVGFDFHTITNTTTAAAELEVTLLATDTDGEPTGAALCTLADPATFTGSGLHVFDAPTATDDVCPVLAASTTYALVMTRGTRTTATDEVKLQTTASDDEDAVTPATGWTLAASYHARGSLIWFLPPSDSPLKVEIIGTVRPGNAPASGAPRITGVFRVGGVLGVDTTGLADADGLTDPMFTHQWIRVAVDGTESDIDGATESTFTLAESDEGDAFKVRVSFTDDKRFTETLESFATRAIAPRAAATGVTLVKNTDQPDGRTVRQLSTALSRHGQAFTTGPNLAGYTINTVGVEFRTITTPSSAGSELTVTLNASEPVGRFHVPGDVLCTLADPDSFAASGVHDFTAPLTGAGACPTLAANTTYNVVIHRTGFTGGVIETQRADDLGTEDALTPATGWKLNNTSPLFSSSHSRWTGDNTGPLRIRVDGDTVVGPLVKNIGRTAHSDPAELTDTVIAFSQAFRTGANEGGYELDSAGFDFGTITNTATAPAELGAGIFATDSNGDPLGSALCTLVDPASFSASGLQFFDAPTGDEPCPVLEPNSNYAVVLSRLTYTPGDLVELQRAADGDEDTLTPATGWTLADDHRYYQSAVWNAEDGPVRVEVRGTVSHPANIDAMGVLTISGINTVLEGLSVSTADITDGNGLDDAIFRYRWISVAADDTESYIAGARLSVYVIGPKQAGKSIKAEVFFIDDDGYHEVLTSEATEIVLADNRPTIIGVERVKETLSVSTAGITDDDGLDDATAADAFTYLWIRVEPDDTEADITGATSSTYLLARADIDKRIKVKVDFTDDNSNPETRTSYPTGVIASNVLVSNVGQTEGTSVQLSSSGTPRQAQEFTTGSHAGGYVLTSIGLRFNGIDSTSTAASQLVATINEVSSSVPGDVICTLGHPRNYRGNAVNTYDASGCPTLEANTNYFFVIRRTVTDSNRIIVPRSRGVAEDAGAADGWSIADAYRGYFSGAWSNIARGALLMRVSGDNAEPGVRLTPPALTVVEGSSGFDDFYNLELTAAPTADVTVTINTAHSDVRVGFGLTFTSLTFTTDAWNTPQEVVVNAVDDLDFVDDRVTVAHAVAAGSATEYVGVTLDGLAVTVIDDDRGVTLTPTALTVTEGTTGTYTVELNIAPSDDVTVSVTGDGDVTVDPTSLTFSTASWNTAQAVTVTAADDENDADDTVTVTHAVLDGSATEFVDLTLDALVVTITDDDRVVTGTEITLVANTGQDDDGTVRPMSISTPSRAQEFTTGPSASAYGFVLGSIGIDFDDITNVSTVGSQLTVTLNARSGGNPGSVLCTLTDPATFTVSGVQTFGAPATATGRCPVLAENTTYYVVVTRGTIVAADDIELKVTTASDEDSGGAAGWSIRNDRHWFNNGLWRVDLAESHMIEVKGVVIGPPKRVTGFDLHSDNARPFGIWGNESTIWVANDVFPNGSNDKLFAYDRSDGSRNATEDFNTLFGAGNRRPTGLCSDGTTMFVLDRADHEVYAYKMSDKSRDSTKDINLAGANDKSEGLWCNGDTVWVAEDDFGGSNDIFAYNRADGTANTDVDFPALDPVVDGSRLNANPRGIWSNGETMFVVDNEDATVYAWKMADQTRDSAREISLDADNVNAEGLWFDGRVLWVIDNTDDSVYAYDLPGAQPGNTPASGDPAVLTPDTPEAGDELTADVSGITDGTDGLANAYFYYQWIRVDGTDETELDGETGSTYTLTGDDVGTQLRVRVIFDDDAGYREYPRTSPLPIVEEPEAPIVLVKNTGQTVDSAAHSLLAAFPRRAQAFTTGDAPGGYALSSIGVRFGTIVSTSTAGADLTVTLNGGGGNPGAALCTLDDPATFTANAVNTFDAPASGTDQCPLLAANTTYFVVVTRVAFNAANIINLSAATGGGEDTGGAAGWSIGNKRHYREGTVWKSFSPPHMIDVQGFVIPPPPRVTGFALHSDNADPVGVWGNESTVWVANNVSPDGSNDKLFAYDRSDGSRAADGDFNTLSAAGNGQPRGICSDGTTMFVVDGGDDEVYAYKMSDTSRDSTKDITLTSANDAPSGLWCDATTVWVANNASAAANKIFAYKRSDGTHDATKDMESLYDSTAAGIDNATQPRGLWSDGTTMFVVDSEDNKIFAYKLSDESQDTARNLLLDAANAAARGLWFDGRVLWVVDADDDRFYVYDLPGAQPGNTVASGTPAVRTPTSEEVWTATLSPGDRGGGDRRAGYITLPGPATGSLTPPTFTLDGVTYTVRNLYDSDLSTNDGSLVLRVTRDIPREFTISVAGESFSSVSAVRDTPSGGFEYTWTGADLSWITTIGTEYPVVLRVDSAPEAGVEVTADVSGITDPTDGVANADFSYQWFRVDGTGETELDGETGSTYTPTGADVNKHLKVRVIFDDDAGNEEYPRTSRQLGPVGVAPDVLVANTAQAVAGILGLSTANPQRAQGFTTGANPGGYTLSAVGVGFDAIDSVSTAGSQLTVTINEVSGSEPGDVVCTLGHPGTYVSGAVNTYDASGCPTLDASTGYMVVLHRTTVDSNRIRLDRTSSTSEDSGSADGWSIADSRHFIASGSWSSTSAGVQLIEIRGENAVERPGVTVTPSSLTVAEGDTGTYTVELSVVPTGDVTVSVTGGGDVTVSPASLTFSTSSWNTAQTVTVTAGHDDDAADDTQTVAHAVVTGGATEYDGATLDGVDVTITDDEEPGVTVSPSSLEVDEGDTGTYTVELSVIPTGDVTVSVSGGGDVTVSPEALTFSTGDWSTAQTVTVTAAQDDDGADDTVTVAHAVVDGSATEYVGETLDGVDVTITDDEEPGVTVLPSSLTVAEGATGTYTVKLSVVPTGDVTVSVTGGGDVTVSPAALTFSTATWNTAQTVTVTAAHDVDTTDDPETVAHAVLDGSATEYVDATLDGLAVTVTDDDDPARAAPVLVKNTGQTVSGASGIDSTATSRSRAQGFTTGSNALGYRPASIGVEFDQIGSVSTVGSGLAVTLMEADGSDPGSRRICGLTHPGTFVAGALNTFGASDCPALAANTMYFVVVTSSHAGTDLIRLDTTTSTTDDTGAADGWSIADTRHHAGSGSWTTTAGAHLIEVKGFAILPPPRVTGFALDGDNADPVGVWGDETTVWVANNVSPDGGNDKLFAYDRSDGSRDADSDFGTLDAAGNGQPRGICSDGTTMFVVDGGDDEVYAYKMADRSRDSTKDVTLTSANNAPSGLWCDADTIWVANNASGAASKIFAYKRSDGTHDATRDMESLYDSSASAGDNATSPRGLWSDGTTMFVTDSDDDKVFAFKLSDESQDTARNITLDAGNDDPRGLWFDGRVLWVIDATGGRFYVYELPGGQPDNTRAFGGPAVLNSDSDRVWSATLTAGAHPGVGGVGYVTVPAPAAGSLSPGAAFTVDGDTYTVAALYDTDAALSAGSVYFDLDKEVPRDFVLSVGSGDAFVAGRARAIPGGVRYEWKDTDPSWSAGLSQSVDLLVNSAPRAGVELTTDVSAITDVTDGLNSGLFQYQWLRVDGTGETELDGETGSTYTPTGADVNKHLKVRVIFDDNAGNKEHPRTSRRLGPVGVESGVLAANTRQAVTAASFVALSTVNPQRAQGFTTGSNVGGYTLSAVGVDFSSIDSVSTAGAS